MKIRILILFGIFGLIVLNGCANKLVEGNTTNEIYKNHLTKAYDYWIEGNYKEGDLHYKLARSLIRYVDHSFDTVIIQNYSIEEMEIILERSNNFIGR